MLWRHFDDVDLDWFQAQRTLGISFFALRQVQDFEPISYVAHRLKPRISRITTVKHKMQENTATQKYSDNSTFFEKWHIDDFHTRSNKHFTRQYVKENQLNELKLERRCLMNPRCVYLNYWKFPDVRSEHVRTRTKMTIKRSFCTQCFCLIQLFTYNNLYEWTIIDLYD